MNFKKERIPRTIDFQHLCDRTEIMKKCPTHIKHKLRKLAMAAAEEELKLQLQELAENFEIWKAGNISSRELRHILHTYINGKSRELFNRNRSVPDDILVADAVVRGILKKDDITEDVLPYIQNGIHFYQDMLDSKNKGHS